MTREDIIRMAREAGINVEQGFLLRFAGVEDDLERFAALVAAAERERIIAANAPEIEKVNVYIKALEDAVAAEREKVAAWMIDRSYATGHGDTIEDLLVELEWQVRESERKACARVAEELWQQYQDTKDAHERLSLEPFMPGRFGFDQSTVQQSRRIADDIRARGEKT